MLGLFATLNLGARSLQAQQTAVEIAGQNLANVNNPAYTRQRVLLQTSPAIASGVGPQGTGVEAVAIQQIRDAMLEAQMRGETSVGGYWTAQQQALQATQAGLGQFIGGNDTPLGGLSDELNDLFRAFQSVATSPTSLTGRQDLLNQAQALATRFNQTSARLADTSTRLDEAVQQDVATVNQLLSDLAQLNQGIARAESPGGGLANDLRDLREQKLAALAQLVNFETSETAGGMVDLSLNGVPLVAGASVLDTLETYAGPNGGLLVRTTTGATNLTPTGGSLAGTIEARDGTLQSLRDGLDTLAASLINEVNSVHRGGFSLTGSTGADFFTGTNASDLAVNGALLGDPALVQAAGVNGATGDNAVALALAHLAQQAQTGLGNQTFAGNYGQLVSALGHDLKTANDQLAAHEAVTTMLQRQRDAVSGVSVDEEMTDLVRFQRAYQASARIITTVDEMLQTVLNMKQ